ncbi:MAG: vWA domain-containing protein [Hyphomicrobiales bacterium]
MTCKSLRTARQTGWILLTVFLFLSGVSSGSAGEKVIVVFDASGSMWGQIEGNSKINIARGVLKRSIEEWKALDLEVGLIVYGHRRKGDCADIETLIPSGPINVGRFTSTIDGIRPTGKTPLTAAVRKAAEELRYTEDKATVILLSDGLETCNLDPCAIASELERDGVNFTAHVIGFDIAKGEEQRQLRCIAENTGGLFVAADDADGLSVAFEQVIALKPLTLVAISGTDGREVPGPVHWTVRGGEVQIERTTETARLEIPEIPNGSYQVRVEAGPYKSDGRYEIGDNRSESISVELAAELPKATVAAGDTVPASEEFQVNWTGPGAPGDKIQLARPGSVPGSSFVQSVDASEGSPVTMRAPIEKGVYELRYYSGELKKLLAQRRIEVGEPLPTAFLTALDEVPAGMTFEIAWTGPGEAPDWVDIAKPGTPAGQYLSYVYVKTGNPVKMRAPSEPGTYEIRYLNGSETKIMGRRTLTVVSGGVSLTALDEVPAGTTFEIAWTGPGEAPDWVDIAKPGTPAGQYLSYVYVKTGNPVKLRAPSEPGTYEIRDLNGSETKVMGRRPVTVVRPSASD